MSITEILLLVSALINIVVAITNFITAGISDRLIKDLKSEGNQDSHKIVHRISFRIQGYNDTEYDKDVCDIMQWFRSVCREFDIDGDISFPLDENSHIVTLYLHTSMGKVEQLMDRAKSILSEDAIESIEHKYE